MNTPIDTTAIRALASQTLAKAVAFEALEGPQSPRLMAARERIAFCDEVDSLRAELATAYAEIQAMKYNKRQKKKVLRDTSSTKANSSS